MAGTLLAEGGLVAVVGAVGAKQGILADAHLAPALGQRDGVRRLLRAEAAVATARKRRADGTATGLRHRAQAGGAENLYAWGLAPLALGADGVGGYVRTPAREHCQKRVHELLLVDRAALQLEIDLDVVGDRRRGLERLDVLGMRVDDVRVLLHVGEVLERLDAAGGRAGADRDQELRLLPDLLDSLDLLGCRDRALDESDVVGARDLRSSGLEEVSDLDAAEQRQQLVLAVEQRELATIAGGELPDGEFR